jgi:uncharacterized protein (DUF1697 family)
MNHMPTYIAMLRGINVGGNNTVKMEHLRKSFEGLGYRNVKTYILSGNVIFDARKVSAASLSEEIGARMLRDFGFSVPVLLRTPKEMERIIRDNPFLKQIGIDDSKLHVTFLADVAPEAAEMSLKPLAANPERFHVKGREVYLYCPNGYGRTRLSNNGIEKKLGVGATTRNWKSVNALLALTRQEISL